MKTTYAMTHIFAILMLASFVAGAEPQYPPAFDPIILYQDRDYIATHGQSLPAATRPKPSSQSSPAVQSQGDAAGVLAQNYPVGLVVFSMAGLLIWGIRQPQSGAVARYVERVEFPAGTERETGVARYLKNRPEVVLPVPATGVARYLRSLPPQDVPPPTETGVSKYLKSLPTPAVKLSETGVSRYVKNLAESST